MKEFKDYTFADFERVPRNKTAEVKLAKRHKYKPMKMKSCTIFKKMAYIILDLYQKY